MDELSQNERVAVARLRALLELLPSELDRQMAGTGLGAFEFTLLEALDEAEGNRLRLSALASRTNATLPRLSRVVTGLERKGLVARVPCEDDGRAINALLTDSGRDAYRAGRDVYTRALRRTVLANLESEQVTGLASTMLAMLSSVDPERRMTVTTGDPACAADPAPLAG